MGFPEGLLFGVSERGFVGLAHVVFYHIFFGLTSCVSNLSSHFCYFRLGCRYRAGSLGSPPIGVRSSEASVSSFPGSTNLRPAQMGLSLFGTRHLYLDDGISSDFQSSNTDFSFSSDFRPCHAMPRLCEVVDLSEPSPAMVDLLQGLPGTIVSQGEGFAALFRGLIDAG